MSNRELDKILRERLEQLELEPPMHLWEQIVAARAGTQRPYRPWMWWSGGVGVLVLMAGIGAWLLFGQTSWVSHGEEISGRELLAMADPLDIKSSQALLVETSNEAPESPAAISSVRAIEEEIPASAHSDRFDGPILRETENLDLIAGEEELSVLVEELVIEEELTLQAASINKTQAFNGLHADLKSIDWTPRPKDGFPEKSCKPFSKEKWHLNWNLELVGSPEYVFRTLSPKTPASASYAEARNEMEEIRGGFAAGLRVSAVTDFGISLRAGVQYGQINEVFNYRDSEEIRIIITNVYDGQGNIIGSDTIYESGIHMKTTYNRHRMLDIPVTAGYEFQFPRFSMAVHGGACFNLLFQQKGDIMGPEGEPVSISSGSSTSYPAFRDRLGLSLIGSIGFNYRLRPDLQFIVEPQFRLILDPVTQQGYPLNQDYFLTGITLGVRQQL